MVSVPMQLQDTSTTFQLNVQQIISFFGANSLIFIIYAKFFMGQGNLRLRNSMVCFICGRTQIHANGRKPHDFNKLPPIGLTPEVSLT